MDGVAEPYRLVDCCGDADRCHCSVPQLEYPRAVYSLYRHCQTLSATIRKVFVKCGQTRTRRRPAQHAPGWCWAGAGLGLSRWGRRMLELLRWGRTPHPLPTTSARALDHLCTVFELALAMPRPCAALTPRHALPLPRHALRQHCHGAGDPFPGRGVVCGVGVPRSTRNHLTRRYTAIAA